MENIVNNAAELLILLFIIITFLQSGIDKLTDWKGNMGWLKGHFSKTFLSGSVPLMLGIVLITEIITGILGIIGVFQIIMYDNYDMAFASAALGAVTLLMLLFGQRVAKDYPGAFTITGYFIVTILGVYLYA